MPYISHADVAAFLQIDTSVPDIRADVELVISMAEGVIDTFLGTSYHNSGVNPVSHIYDGNGTNFLMLNPMARELVRVETLDSAGAVTGEIASVHLFPTENGRLGKLFRGLLCPRGGFPEGIRNIQVTGRFGFATVPNDFKLAVLQTAKYIFDSRAIDDHYEEEETVQRSMVVARNRHAIPPLARKMLQKYSYLTLDLSPL